MNTGHFIHSHFKNIYIEQGLMHEMINQISVGICVVQMDGIPKYINKTAIQLLGKSQVIDWENQNMWQLFSEDNRTLIASHIKDYILDDTKLDELQFTENGLSINLQCLSFLKSMLLVTINEIPSQLLVSEAFYRKVVEDQVEFIVHTSVDGKTVFANQAFADFLSLSIEEVNNYHAYDHLFEEDQAEIAQHILTLTEDKPVTTLEHRFMLKDGQIRWLQWAHRAVFDDQGRLCLVQSVGHDITEHKDTQHALEDANTSLEQRLQERNQQLERLVNRVGSILNNLSDAIVLLDVDHGIQQANNIFYQMFDVPYDTYFGQPLHCIFPTSEQGNIEQIVRQVMEEKQTKVIETMIKKPQKADLFVELSLSPIVVQSRIESLVCAIHDISSLKKAEYELMRMLRRERELSELRSRIVSMTSHEFRTPLATIRASSETLRDFSEKMTADQRLKRFNKIDEQVARMAEMLDDILTIGKLEQNSKTIQLETFDFVNFLSDTVDSAREIYGEHQLDCVFSQPSAPVFADKNLMHQVVSNLISNAVKYSAPGSTVFLTLEVQNKRVHLTVRDEGIGIPREDQPRIFEMFHRAKNATAYKGTGLGLVITKRAIEAHKGKITVQSEPGQGTSFIIELPIIAK